MKPTDEQIKALRKGDVVTVRAVVRPPEGFGSNGASDAEFVRGIFEYRDGKLYWAVRPANAVQVGDEAGYTCKASGYRKVMIGGRKSFMVHRIVLLMITGKWPADVDHINGNRADNAIENLRDVSRLVNMQNKGLYSRNKSGVCGVWWRAETGKWAASIALAGKTTHLGHFSSFDDACRVRKEAEENMGFHANHGRVAA